MWKWLSVCVLLMTTLDGCAPAAQPERAASSPAVSAQTEWEREWQKTVAAAKQEGKVVVSGPTRELWRKVLVSFEQEFPGIRVE